MWFSFILLFLSLTVTSEASIESAASEVYRGSRTYIKDASTVDCAKVPPTFWCASEKLTKECGFEELCERYSKATKNEKLQLTLFYESLCPDCQEFIINDFYRNVYLKFGDFIKFELVPYGNAKNEDGKIKCQHGEKECQINKYHSCVLHYMPEPIPFIVCMEARIQDGSTLDKSAEKCYYTFHVQPHVADQIIHCANGDIGDKFQQEAAKRTAQAFPDPHKHVPWVLFNNVSIESQQFLISDLPVAICEFYNGDRAPGNCQGLGSASRTLNGCAKGYFLDQEDSFEA
uniref:Gamma-interferon-inducible lysosomal thiol reductase n=1 Tax=Panagrolaimus sp. ES5 TaxID=591445 RepID=A0AC34EYW5_9BILA